MKIFLGAFLFLLLYRNARAYIDPGTGSYIFQLLLGLLFGMALAWRWVLKILVNSAKFLFAQIGLRAKNVGREDDVSGRAG